MVYDSVVLCMIQHGKFSKKFWLKKFYFQYLSEPKIIKQLLVKKLKSPFIRIKFHITSLLKVRKRIICLFVFALRTIVRLLLLW